MKIEQLDKNFAIVNQENGEEKATYAIPHNIEHFKVVQETYKRVIAEGDNNVYFIAGKELFGKNDRGNCMVDETHTNDLGFYRMAKNL